MGRPRSRAGAGGTGARDLLIAAWDASMARWRIPGEVYAYEDALKSGAPVVVSSGLLLKALVQAGLDAKQFGFGARHCGKWFLLDGDQLTEWTAADQAEWDAGQATGAG